MLSAFLWKLGGTWREQDCEIESSTLPMQALHTCVCVCVFVFVMSKQIIYEVYSYDKI